MVVVCNVLLSKHENKVKISDLSVRLFEEPYILVKNSHSYIPVRVQCTKRVEQEGRMSKSGKKPADLHSRCYPLQVLFFQKGVSIQHLALKF